MTSNIYLAVLCSLTLRIPSSPYGEPQLDLPLFTKAHLRFVSSSFLELTILPAIEVIFVKDAGGDFPQGRTEQGAGLLEAEVASLGLLIPSGVCGDEVWLRGLIAYHCFSSHKMESLMQMFISLEILCGPKEAAVIYVSPLLRTEMKERCPVVGQALSMLQKTNSAPSEGDQGGNKPSAS